MRTAVKTTANDLAYSLNRLIRRSVQRQVSSAAQASLRSRLANLREADEIDTPFELSEESAFPAQPVRGASRRST